MHKKRAKYSVASALLALVALGITDIALDSLRLTSLHLVVEVIMVVLSLGLAVYLWSGWLETELSLARTRRSLEASRTERDVWRERAKASLDGLNRAIYETFRGWELTPAETEIAWYLLSGHSDKTIAKRTGRSVRTVSTHAAAVYRKSDLAGRANLAAFFFEGLIRPLDRR